MARADLDAHFAKIDELTEEIERIVPTDGYQNVQFRSDLAGLLVVAIAATYESCVKDVLYERALRHHVAFGAFAERNFEKLNSRIQIKDLKKYCQLFGSGALQNEFRDRLKERKEKLLQRSGKNIENCYEQVLEWRHAFAHAMVRNHTIEEAVNTHRCAKRVLYVFDEVISGSQ
ncbi:hypothetical protein GTZ99_14465 [Novosphingobium sp. FSY-8]|uniref:RiboL-PSP-HEPN domain-containing protein n=1 Tax=Novosphingobium ovatum TaxID=1908523 RepID=A0ABW9XGY2_9SPHN|nr:HEPN domain-containing protein [Novosphingobium ovatum]NBC37756.1 hypothetical protein [Novosphingobium ovatum]